MKISEVKDGISLKYEGVTVTRQKQEPFTLVGMFMEIPKSYKAGDGNNYQNGGTFIGYIKGTNQLKTLTVYFYNSDKAVAKDLDYRVKKEEFPMNIERLSATRMPKVISDHLKRLHKQYQEENKRQEEIERLEQQSNKANETLEKLSTTLANSLKKELKLDLKRTPEYDLYTSAKKDLELRILARDNSKKRYEVSDIYVNTDNELSLTVVLLMKNRYSLISIYKIGANATERDYAFSYDGFYSSLTNNDRYAIDNINEALSEEKGLTYKIRYNSDPDISYNDNIVIDYNIKVSDLIKVDSLGITLERIF